MVVSGTSDGVGSGGGGGFYVVKESGLEFQHENEKQDAKNKTRKQQQEALPTTPEIFLERFRNNFQMRILERPTPNEMVFEMVNVDVSLVNALRRILLSEIPTVALENVYMWNNSSIIHDEVLAHRIGLIPLNIDARLLDDVDEDDDNPTDRNTVVFKLAVTCSRKDKDNEEHEANDDDEYDGGGGESETVRQDAELEEAAAEAAASAPGRKFRYPQDRPYTKHVYSKDLVWVPQGDQAESLEDVRPIHDDILIAKLRPGQSIELEAHGRRGIGKDHAKYSPVATASYRLMPCVELLEPVYDDLAEELVHVYEPGVFDLVPCDEKTDPPQYTRKARVRNPYACTMSRNYMRNPELAAAVRMTRKPDHFIFSVESLGMADPGVLVAEALRLLQRKCIGAIDLADDCISKTAEA